MKPTCGNVLYIFHQANACQTYTKSRLGCIKRKHSLQNGETYAHDLINQSMKCLKPCRDRELELPSTVSGYNIPQIENMVATVGRTTCLRQVLHPGR
uniref:Uncharacterized protein n=1 Tax=Anopheles atroparvus TaxID=41427 RepID=A0AAG5D792_ANOAO